MARSYAALFALFLKILACVLEITLERSALEFVSITCWLPASRAFIPLSGIVIVFPDIM
ncbi:hypothetical protein ES705_40789 [subsurface metagenome]